MTIKVKLPWKIGDTIHIGIPGGTGDILYPKISSIGKPIFHPETNLVFGIFLVYKLPLSTGGSRKDEIGVSFFIKGKKLIQDQSWLVVDKTKEKKLDTMSFYLDLTRRYVK